MECGHVYHLYFNTLYGEAKHKFCVLAYLQPRPAFFLINSEPSKLKQEQPLLAAAQVIIDQANHGFLSYDSYVDCSTLYGKPLAEIERDFQIDGQTSHLGRVSDEVLGKIITAVKSSHTLEQKKIAFILAALDADSAAEN